MNENKKKIAFIINPISGTQSKEQILKWLDEKLDKERLTILNMTIPSNAPNMPDMPPR